VRGKNTWSAEGESQFQRLLYAKLILVLVSFIIGVEIDFNDQPNRTSLAGKSSGNIRHAGRVN